jgi:hypothetical protein
MADDNQNQGRGQGQQGQGQGRKANIDNPNHQHHLPTIVGATVTPSDPNYLKGAQMQSDGHLSFVGISQTRTATNPDGSVVDRLVIDRTYTPNPKK